jgi:hypothetical protein
MKPNRKRGRPRKLPDEYQVDLINLLHYWQSNGRHSLKAICEHIIKNGGVTWIDAATGKTIAKITDAEILRIRFTEARNWYRHLKWWLSKVQHPLATKFDLPIRFGITVERRRKWKLIALGRPPARVNQLRIGKRMFTGPERKLYNK